MAYLKKHATFCHKYVMTLNNEIELTIDKNIDRGWPYNHQSDLAHRKNTKSKGVCLFAYLRTMSKRERGRASIIENTIPLSMQ